MNNMPKKLREELDADPFYHVCARHNDDCDGRVTWEHAIIYAGRQVQRKWAIIPLCEFHHLRDGLNKTWNIWFAMSRATADDRKEFDRLKWSK